ncbi:hypothetical protein Zmor_012857 [Zophobas morio]|uniref:Uncharacterized protein n=1 Tax=Zophobas morio TaxID=2755281 RepID=A0AA38MEQ4_9CUCU|nr:hypothetical protein Zmor_012857 [Zophobas morio]
MSAAAGGAGAAGALAAAKDARHVHSVCVCDPNERRCYRESLSGQGRGRGGEGPAAGNTTEVAMQRGIRRTKGRAGQRRAAGGLKIRVQVLGDGEI